MANVVTCPSCNRSLRVPDELVGTTVQCPSCKKTFKARLIDEPAEEQPRRGRPANDDDADEQPARRRNLAPHRGDTIQLLGILSFFIGVLGPVSWIMGNGDLAEMDAGRMDPAGRKATESGRLCGKISTIVHACVVGGVFLIWISMIVIMFVIYGSFFCCCLSASAGGAAGGPR